MRGTAAEAGNGRWKERLRARGRIEGLKEGDRYRVTVQPRRLFEGRVVVVDPPYEFSGTVEGLNDWLLCLRTHDVAATPDSGHVACSWLSTWGALKADVEALGERWRRLLDTLAADEA